MNRTNCKPANRFSSLKKYMLALLLVFSLSLSAASPADAISYLTESGTSIEIPEYSGEPYTQINGNVPLFGSNELTAYSYEEYSELDALGRCGAAKACIGTDLMPTEERGSIGQVKPSGWHTVKYDVVDGNYLYNRCHLIAYELSGENANECNLITGTRYMNVTGMLPFENDVAEYVKETGNHVLYRVTPVFEGENLIASGVLMEAYSVEDSGAGICFHVFVYNIQPGVSIDYATGDSALSDSTAAADSTKMTYIVNINTKKFHLPSCSSVDDMAEHNKKTYTGSRESLIENGYSPCQRCNP